jgi:hypothetical protein
MLRIRPAAFEDVPAIRQLNERNGMSSGRLWLEGHPFADEFQDIPMGWVLETDDGSVVGNLDNVHMLYELGGRQIKGVVAAGWVVDQRHRGKSLQLITAFLGQKGVDLCLIDSASPVTAQVLTAMKIPRIPVPDYATPCFWAVRPRAFARAALLRKSIPGAAFLAWPAGLALLARDIYRGSGRGELTSTVRRLEKFDDRFDEVTHKGSVLRAVRNRAVLEWRFRSELRDGRGVIIAAEQEKKLLGYAVLVRREGSELGMNLCDVADIQAAGDDPATIRNLLLGSIKIAREEGVDALKFMSGTPVKRGPANALQPYTYRLPFWQLYYKAASSELGSALSTADAWDFSLFDTF